MSTAGRRVAYATVLTVIAATFAVGSALHSGRQLQLGGWRFSEPVISGAAVVEGACAVVFLLAAFAVAARVRAASAAVRLAHIAGITGVLLGMTALALGFGPRTRSNDLYHLAVLVVMLLSLTYHRRRGSRLRADTSSPTNRTAIEDTLRPEATQG